MYSCGATPHTNALKKEDKTMTFMNNMRAALLSLAAAATLAAQPVSFNMPPRDFTTGNGLLAFAAGDFNGDGKLDIVASQGAYNGVGVLLGNGDGTFQAPITSPGGINANALAVGDFNGDGKLDAVLANADGNTLSVLLGNGDGTFQAPVNYSIPNGPVGVAVADFNNDGILDLVTIETSNRSAFVAVLLGRGDGTFQAPATSATTEKPLNFVVGDFNHDGKMDVAVLSDFSISVLLGTGTGKFQAPVFTDPGYHEFISMAAADLNGDGNEDLVINFRGDRPAQVLILPGNGDGTFQTAVPQAFPGWVRVLADMNHDGKLDLVGVNPFQNTAIVLLGNGNGTFAGSASSTYTGFGPNLALVGNFSGGPAPDLVTANAAFTVSILLSQGNGTFVAPTPYKAPGGARQVVTADFNHDGNPDLVTIDQHRISILLGKSDGTFHKAVTYAAGGSPSSVAVGDFNHDGKLDLAVCNNEKTNVLVILLGNGDGTFQPAATVDTGGVDLVGSLAAADFNKDGKLDLVVASTTGNTLLVLLGKGNGTFKSPQAVTLDFSPQIVATADFNNDGKADLVAGGGGSLIVLLGNGDGTFQTGQAYTLAADLFRPAIGDLNGDGNPDLVIPGFTDAGPTGLFVLLGNGDGTFQGPMLYPGTLAFSAALADFNGDGKLDVALANNEGNDAAVLLGNGDGTLGLPTYFPAGNTVIGTAAPIFKGQKPSLALGSDAGVAVLLNQTP
jgi:hypothetical protein